MLEVIDKAPQRESVSTPLLFVHGASHGAWCRDEHFLNFLAARGHRSLAVGLRGHENSAPATGKGVGVAADQSHVGVPGQQPCSRQSGQLGHVDILCNNAAAPGEDRWIWEQTLENWNATIAIDVTAAMLCTREVLNQSMLQRRRGVILNFSSTASYSGVVRKSHYVTAKAALRAFTKTVALEVGPYGSRCNCIAPGAPPTSKAPTLKPNAQNTLNVLHCKIFRLPEDVANLALFLAGDDSRTITGQSIPVDAGGYMQG